MELEDIALCDRMRVDWVTLQRIPQHVIRDYRLVMEAEAEAARVREHWRDR